jgi:membrane-associated phospholipid phosphatase
MIEPVLLGSAAVVAGGAFAWLSRAVQRRDTADMDREIHRRLTPRQDSSIRTAGDAIGPIGKWYAYVPAALGIAGALMRRDDRGILRARKRRNRRRGAGAIAASGIAAYAINKVFDNALPQPPSPPGQPRGKPVFPSGHAFGPLTVGLVSSYVLARDRLASPAVTLPLSLAIPLVSATTRIVKEKHWGSDIVGGVLGGIAVAGSILALFEWTYDS